MTEKLARNTSDERWREYWKAVDAAASNAPKLQFDEATSSPRSREQERAVTKSSKPKKREVAT